MKFWIERGYRSEDDIPVYKTLLETEDEQEAYDFWNGLADHKVALPVGYYTFTNEASIHTWMGVIASFRINKNRTFTNWNGTFDLL